MGNLGNFWASVKSPCSCFMLSLICLVSYRLTHLHDSFLTPSQNAVPASKTTNHVVLGLTPVRTDHTVLV